MTMEDDDGPPLIDHIGLDLWQASMAWKARFIGEMVRQGFSWIGEARGSLIHHMEREGISQMKLAARAGITKQAVQQQLDELERDGVVERVADPDDARRKIVRFAPEGLRALEAASQIKQAIEKDYARMLGKHDMNVLKRSLRAILHDGRKT